VAQIVLVTSDGGAAQVIRAAYADGDVRAVDDLRTFSGESDATAADYVYIDVSALRALGEEDDPSGSLATLRTTFPGAQVVVLSEQSGIREAIGYVREGASDYLTYPIVDEEVQLVRESIERRERLSSELRYFRDQATEMEAVGSISSRADSMKAALRKIRQVAPTRSTVLLTGETGTGKSFLAKVIHQNSTRSQRQFVSVHCGAIPDSLLESELFGHERGAFTGADRRKLGKFEIADGGTIFLDEVATISPAMQVKLLNVLQERSIQRIGGEQDIAVDVRILAATNMDLEKMTEKGEFRRDLFFRLNVFPIDIPPLRQRREDIPAFVEIFLERLRLLHQKEIDRVQPAVMEALVGYEWPGNVRELENLLERAYILEASAALSPGSFPEELFQEDVAGSVAVDTGSSLATVRGRAADHAELLYLREQLAIHHGRIDATAAAAGITTRQLHKLMMKHALKKEHFKHGMPETGTIDSDR
jgi:DNA-binding NtrC family response regulator